MIETKRRPKVTKAPAREPVVFVEQADHGLNEGRVVTLHADRLEWVRETRVEDEALVAELDRIPAAAVYELRYQETVGVKAAAAGVVVLALALGALALPFLAGVFSLWLTFIGLGAIPVGLVWIAGIRRRSIVFRTQNRDLRWVSGALEYRSAGHLAHQARQWAESNAIYTVGFPDALTLLGYGRLVPAQLRHR